MGNALKDRLAQYFTPYKPQSVAEAAEKFMGGIFGQRPGMSGGANGGFMPMTPVGAREGKPNDPFTPMAPAAPADPWGPIKNSPQSTQDTLTSLGYTQQNGYNPNGYDPSVGVPNVQYTPPSMTPGQGTIGGNPETYSSKDLGGYNQEWYEALNRKLPVLSPIPVSGPGSGAQGGNRVIVDSMLDENGNLLPQYALPQYSGTQNRNNKPFNPHDDFTIK